MVDLGLIDRDVSLASATNVRDLITTLEKKTNLGIK